MKERTPTTETEIDHEAILAPEHSPDRDKVQDKLQETTTEQEHNHSIDKIQESIHREAISSKDIQIEEPLRDGPRPMLGMQQELKSDAYKKTLYKVRGQLSPTERSLSKLFHHRSLEPINELGSRTIARPSGILGGGIAALIGSSVVLYMSKHYGFQYNFTTFILLLAGGFSAGLLVELLSWLIRRRRM